MKGKKCFGVLLLFSITFLLSLSVFSDTNALVLSSGVVPTGRTADVNSSNVVCLLSDLTDPNATQYAGQIGSMGECVLSNSPEKPIALESFYVSQPLTVRQGYYYNVFFGYQTINSMNDVLWHPSVPAGGNWRLVEMQEVTHDEFISGCLRWRPVSYPADINTPDYCEQYYGAGASNPSLGVGWKTTWYSITLMALQDSDSTYFYLGEPTRQPRSFLVGRGGQVFMSNIVEYEPTGYAEQQMNQKDNEDRNNIESQSSEASGDADGSQADVEELGSNFADYIGGVATALGTSPTDCEIRANFGIGNFDAGTVDLCELSLPQEFQVIGSILMIAFVVPLAWATLNKIIALIRSFQ